MKITKSKNRVDYLKDQKLIANKDCNVCPCCGENKKSFYYLKQNITNKGIFDGVCRTWAAGFIHMKHMKVDCYSCKTCGAEWESEPYEYI